jgi:hypothetical protein
MNGRAPCPPVFFRGIMGNGAGSIAVAFRNVSRHFGAVHHGTGALLEWFAAAPRQSIHTRNGRVLRPTRSALDRLIARFRCR